jgi:hypothetical protein
MRLLSIDLGYSSTKVVYYNENGILQFDKFISAVAKIDNPMEADDDVMFRLGVNYYILGTAALKVPRSLLLNLENFDDLKTAYPVWISYLLKKYGGANSFDKVVLGLSMAYSNRADELLQYLYETLMIEKEDYFMCLPQGLSCKLAYSECGLDIRETSKHNDFRMRNYIILDGGFLTCDMCNVANGTASAGAAIGVPNTGIICIAYDVIDYLFKEFNMKASVKEAQTIIDNNGKFSRRGKEYNISTKIDEFTKKYLSNVLKLLEEKFGEAVDAVEGILVCGGLSYFFKKYIDDPQMIKEIEKHFPVSFLHFPVVDSEFFNSYSYLRAAEKILDQDI